MNPRAPRSKTDGNQREIIVALEAAGVVVRDLSAVGEGMNDLFCALPAAHFLIEVKMPGQLLNARQKKWHALCPWRNHIAHSAAEAVAIAEYYKEKKRG